MLLTFNADVWGRIFHYGGLTAVDAQSLVATNHALRETLLSDQKIWSNLFHKEWGPLFEDFLLQVPSPRRWHFLVIQFQAILNWLQVRVCADYSSQLTHQLIRKLCRLSLYLPIAVRLLLKHETLLFDGIEGATAQQAIRFSTVYQLANLVNASMFRLSLDWFKSHFTTLPENENIEVACVRLSLLESDCYRYIHMRQIKLAQIRSRFKTDISDVILNGQKPHMAIENCLAHTKPILRLDSVNDYKSLILELSIVVLSCFDFDHLIPSEATSTGMLGTDDYSLVRFYAGVSVGCSLMMLIVIQKALREFFARFELYVARKHMNFHSSLAKYCLVFYGFGCLFALYVTEPYRGYIVNFDNSEEVRSFFRARHVRPEDAAKFIEPVTILKLVHSHIKKNPDHIQTYHFLGEQFRGRNHVRRVDGVQYRLAASTLSFTEDPSHSFAAANVENLWLQFWRGNNSIHLLSVATYVPNSDYLTIKDKFREEQSSLAATKQRGNLTEIVREYWPCDKHGMFVQHKRHQLNRGIILGYRDVHETHFVVAVPQGLAIWDIDSAVASMGDIRTNLQEWLRDMGFDHDRLRGFDRLLVSDTEVRFLRCADPGPECVDEAFGLRSFMKGKFRIQSARSRA